MQADLPSLIELTAAHGFPFVTVAPARYAEARLYGIDDAALRDQLHNTGIAVGVVDQVSAGLPGLARGDQSALAPTHRTGMSLDLCAGIARGLGCGLLNVSHYRGDPATAIDSLAQALATMSREAADQGLVLSLEFIPGTGIPDLATAAAIRAMIAPDKLPLVIDTCHFARSGGTIDEIVALPANSIAVVQLGDLSGTEEAGSRTLPGEGQLPLHAIVAAALANSPDLSLQVEVFSPELRRLPPSVAAARVATAIDAWLNSAPR
jgi:sugar phosphate isomerase/epimerase